MGLDHYSATYAQLDADGKVLVKQTTAACFAAVYNDGVHEECTKLVIWEKITDTPPDRLKRYYDKIKELGFPFEHLGKKSSYPNIPDVNNHDIIEIDVTKIDKIAYLCTLLDLIRWPYDSKRSFAMVEKFDQALQAHPELTPWQLVLLASKTCGFGYDHTMHYYPIDHEFTFQQYLDELQFLSKGIHNSIRNMRLSEVFLKLGGKADDRDEMSSEDAYNALFKKEKPVLKVHVVGSQTGYANWLPKHLKVKSIPECDVVMFTGGEDIDPAIYGDKPHPRTYTSAQRNKQEIAAFKEAVANKKKIIGICRGAQLICAMSGGKLIQDQENPSDLHPMKLYDGTTIQISSLHHQAMYPFDIPKWDWKLLGWTKGMSRTHQNGDQEEMNPEVEVEIALFKKCRGLAIQGHPEMGYFQSASPESLDRIKLMFDDFMADKL